MSENSNNRIKQMLRDPFVHFLMAGAAIYLLFFLVQEPETVVNDKSVVVTQGEVEWFVSAWGERWGRPPTREELDGVIAQHVRETILYREAQEMGLDRDDVVIRRRMAQKIEFLTQDLLQPPNPTDEQLNTFFEENKDQYHPEQVITFTQIFFDPDKRGNSTLDDAEQSRTTLSGLAEVPTDLSSFGDAFFLQRYFPQKPKSEIARLLGHGFADPLFELDTGVWHGPVLSGYGTHLVFVHDRRDPPMPELNNIRAQVSEEWTASERQKLNKQFIDQLTASYSITVEPVPEIVLSPDKDGGS